MREHKFRGIPKENDDFVYGLPKIIKNGDGTQSVFICFQNKQNRYVEVEIIPDTLGEYSGLKDKNKKEIYEDDLVRIYETPRHALEAVQDIFFNEGMFKVGKKEDYETPLAFLTNVYYRGKTCNFVEIIGNKHQNPELIDGENDE